MAASMPLLPAAFEASDLAARRCSRDGGRESAEAG